MTSPFVPGVIHLVRAGGVRVVFYVRIACADDPHTARQRQPRVITAVLSTEELIVGYCADVGPWNGLRGSIRSTDTWDLDGHLTGGGLVELLDHACRPNRYADVVAYIDVDRLSHRLVERVRIENGFTEHDVGVAAPKDPMITMIVRDRVRRMVGGSR